LVHPDNQEPEQLEQLTRQVYATAHQGQRLEAGLIRSALKTVTVLHWQKMSWAKTWP